MHPLRYIPHYLAPKTLLTGKRFVQLARWVGLAVCMYGHGHYALVNFFVRDQEQWHMQFDRSSTPLHVVDTRLEPRLATDHRGPRPMDFSPDGQEQFSAQQETGLYHVKITTRYQFSI